MRLGEMIVVLTLGMLLAACGASVAESEDGGEDGSSVECQTDEDCDDGDPCTLNFCLEETGTCSTQAVLEPPAEEGPFGDPSCENGIDDDCDLAIDEQDKNCRPECESDDECVDDNACTVDICAEGLCTNAPAENGVACDDGQSCTTDDACLDGACTGLTMDCSHLDTPCTRGVCVEYLEDCGVEDLEYGTPCEFFDYCSTVGSCRFGECLGNNDRDTDGDGYVDEACPPGNDCDDENATVNPGAVEGPPWGSLCADGLDNDCNGTVDAEDFSCHDGAGMCDANGWCWENPTPQGNHLMGLWAISPDDIWAVGKSNTVLRYDGMGWYRATSLIGEDRHDVWASGTDDVWSLQRSHMTHWDGEQWRSDRIGGGDFYDMWGSSPTDILVAGRSVYRFDGTQWENQGLPEAGSVFGFAWDDIWAVGGGGHIWHFDGTEWTELESVTDSFLVSIWGSNPDDVWVAGDDATLLHWDGIEWSVITDAPMRAVNLNMAWGTAPDDIWISGTRSGKYNHMSHWDGEAWSEPDVRETWVGAGLALTESNMLAVGQNGLMLQWDGTEWTDVSRDVVGGWNNIHGACIRPGSDEAWAVGTDGRIIQRDAATGAWAVLDSGTTRHLKGVWCGPTDRAWAVGVYGTILAWDDAAGTWSPSESGTEENLYSVWATTSGDEVWAVGSAGVTLHYSEGAWTHLPDVTTENLLAVSGTGPDNVWAAGENGTILHWDGSTWAQQTTPTVTRLNTVFVLDAEQVWVGGNDGVLLRLVPDTGEWESVALSTDENIAAIWASASDNVWLAAYDEVWHFDGELWHRNREDLFRGISALWGNSTGNIWTVTRLGGRIRRKTP